LRCSSPIRPCATRLNRRRRAVSSFQVQRLPMPAQPREV
jgi:hypothetical protein